MKQLKFKDILDLYFKLREKYGIDTTLQMPVYLGDDDELNGIHCAWYCEMLEAENEEDADFVELINENCCNLPLKDKGILIS